LCLTIRRVCTLCAKATPDVWREEESRTLARRRSRKRLMLWYVSHSRASEVATEDRRCREAGIDFNGSLRKKIENLNDSMLINDFLLPKIFGSYLIQCFQVTNAANTPAHALNQSAQSKSCIFQYDKYSHLSCSSTKLLEGLTAGLVAIFGRLLKTLS